MYRLAILSILFAATAAFQASMPFHGPAKAISSSTARHIILSDEETEKILSTANDCAAGECSIDDVSELIYELKEQQKEMEDRLEKIMNMVAHLQHVNTKEDRDHDEVRGFIKDLLRVFAHETPNFTPVGFTGDIGKGTKTAYDALPPKKWKPSA